MSTSVERRISIAMWQLFATAIFLILGWWFTTEFAQAGLGFTIGAGFVGAGLSLFISFIESPLEKPNQMAISIVTAAFILVAGW